MRRNQTVFYVCRAIEPSPTLWTKTGSAVVVSGPHSSLDGLCWGGEAHLIVIHDDKYRGPHPGVLLPGDEIRWFAYRDKRHVEERIGTPEIRGCSCCMEIQ